MHIYEQQRGEEAPSETRRQRWPPFLSEVVRSATSMQKGCSDVAKWLSSLRSSVAPRLSELLTKTYLMPSESSFSIMPEPSREG